MPKLLARDIHTLAKRDDAHDEFSDAAICVSAGASVVIGAARRAPPPRTALAGELGPLLDSL
ncbi:MAG: hypothetical protein ABI981_00930 [Betaproteobacteria bacterium]